MCSPRLCTTRAYNAGAGWNPCSENRRASVTPSMATSRHARGAQPSAPGRDSSRRACSPAYERAVGAAPGNGPMSGNAGKTTCCTPRCACSQCDDVQRCRKREWLRHLVRDVVDADNHDREVRGPRPVSSADARACRRSRAAARRPAASAPRRQCARPRRVPEVARRPLPAFARQRRSARVRRRSERAQASRTCALERLAAVPAARATGRPTVAGASPGDTAAARARPSQRHGSRPHARRRRSLGPQHHLRAAEQRQRTAARRMRDDRVPDLRRAPLVHGADRRPQPAFGRGAEEVRLELDGGEVAGAAGRCAIVAKPAPVSASAITEAACRKPFGVRNSGRTSYSMTSRPSDSSVTSQPNQPGSVRSRRVCSCSMVTADPGHLEVVGWQWQVVASSVGCHPERSEGARLVEDGDSSSFGDESE